MDGPSAEHLNELVDRATRRPDMAAHKALQTALGSAPPAALEVQKALRRVLVEEDAPRQVLAANLLHSLIQSCPSLRLAVGSSRDWHKLLVDLVASPQTHMQLRSNVAKMLQSAAKRAASDITYQPFATLWNSIVQRGLVRVVPPRSAVSASAPPPSQPKQSQQGEQEQILSKYEINLSAIKAAEVALARAIVRGDRRATGTLYATAVEAERDAAEQKNKLVAERRKIQLALGGNKVLEVPELVTRLIDTNTRINALLEEYALFSKRCAQVYGYSNSSFLEVINTALNRPTVDPEVQKQYSALVSRIKLPQASMEALFTVHTTAIMFSAASAASTPPPTASAPQAANKTTVRDVLFARPSVRRRSAYGLREAYRAMFDCECL